MSADTYLEINMFMCDNQCDVSCLHPLRLTFFFFFVIKTVMTIMLLISERFPFSIEVFFFCFVFLQCYVKTENFEGRQNNEDVLYCIYTILPFCRFLFFASWKITLIRSWQCSGGEGQRQHRGWQRARGHKRYSQCFVRRSEGDLPKGQEN